MNYPSNAMQSALEQFNNWLTDNGIDSRALFSGEIDFSTALSIKPININAYDQAIDIAKRLEKSTSVAKEFTDLANNNMRENLLDVSQEFLDPNKSFGDLIKEGPKTAVEQKFMEAVDTFLSPQEKKQAAEQNMPIGEVSKLVEQSIQKSQEIILQNNVKDKQLEKSENSREVEKQPEEKMTSLGQEYGVMNKIVESMRQALEDGRDNAIKKEQSQNKPQTFKFETTTLDNIGQTLKDMAKDPNHTQQRGQGLSR